MPRYIEDDDSDLLNQFLTDTGEKPLQTGDRVDLDEFVGRANHRIEDLAARTPINALKPSLFHVGGSSLTGKPEDSKELRARDILDFLHNNPDVTALELLQRAGMGWAPLGFLDGMTDRAQLGLFHSLKQLREQGNDQEFSIIVRAPKEVREAPVADLAAHLKVMEPDTVAFIFLDSTAGALRQGLRRRGWREGIHYEFLERTAMLAHERATLRRLLALKPTSPLHVVRKLQNKT